MQLFVVIALMCLTNTLLPDFLRKYVSREWTTGPPNG